MTDGEKNVQQPAPPARRGHPTLSALLWIATAVAAGAGFQWLRQRSADAPDGGTATYRPGRETLEKCLAEFRENPEDQELRERIVRLAAQADPPPEIPGEARDRCSRGREIFAAAETIEDVDRAADEFRAALLAAPWWPEANRDLGLALEMAQQREEALAALRLYLASGPDPAEARAAAAAARRIEAALRASEDGQPDADIACEVLVPTLVPDYWFYVDGRLISAPPHEEADEFLTAISTSDELVFMDNEGVAARANRQEGYLVYVRENMKDKVRSRHVIYLEPGTHRFEVLLLNASGFPLAVRSETVEMKAGDEPEILLHLPPGYTRNPGIFAAVAVPFNEPWQQKFDRHQAFLKKNISSLAADPVARALRRALLELQLSPPKRPVVPVELPEDLGGRREMDARLVSSLIGYLKNNYRVYEELASASADDAAEYRNAQARLLPLIRAHNARLSELEEINRILAEAGE